VVQLSAPYILFNLWCAIGLPSPLAGYNTHNSTSRDPTRPYTHHDCSTSLASFGYSAAFPFGAVGKCQDSKHLVSKKILFNLHNRNKIQRTFFQSSLKVFIICVIQMCSKTTENFHLLTGGCSKIHQKNLNSASPQPLP